MNGRTAKKLRKAAANELGLDAMPMQYVQKAKGPIENHPRSVKGFYLRLKKAWKKG